MLYLPCHFCGQLGLDPLDQICDQLWWCGSFLQESHRGQMGKYMVKCMWATLLLQWSSLAMISTHMLWWMMAGPMWPSVTSLTTLDLHCSLWYPLVVSSVGHLLWSSLVTRMASALLVRERLLHLYQQCWIISLPSNFPCFTWQEIGESVDSGSMYLIVRMLILWNAFGCAAAVLPTLSSWIPLTWPQLRQKAGSQSSSRARALKLTSSPLSSEGGEFTRQAEVTFLPGNERLTIRQDFKGIDEHDHLMMSTTLEGRVPELPQGSTLQIEPYSEVYQYSNNCKKHY